MKLPIMFCLTKTKLRIAATNSVNTNSNKGKRKQRLYISSFFKTLNVLVLTIFFVLSYELYIFHTRYKSQTPISFIVIV